MGLILAIKDLNAVINTIRSSKDKADALKLLMHSFGFSQKQAEGILGMTLRRLTTMEIDNLTKEQQMLTSKVEDLEDLLNKPDRILQEVKKEASELERKYRSKRRTRVVENESWELSQLDIIPNVPSIVMYSRQGIVWRLMPGSFITRKRGGKGDFSVQIEAFTS